MPDSKSDPDFVYVTHIRATPEKVWEALTSPAFTERYWSGTRIESDWKVGGPLGLRAANGEVMDSGEVLEFEPFARLSYSFLVGWSEAFKSEGPSRVLFTLELQGETVKLTLTHDRFPAGSKVREAVSQGWPSLLSSLKSLLETGEPLPGNDAEAAEAQRRKLLEQTNAHA